MTDRRHTGPAAHPDDTLTASPTAPPADRLAAELRRWRLSRWPTGAGFARAAGWSQSKVSKIETGATLPSEEDVTRWLECTVDDEALRARLGTQLSGLRTTALGDKGPRPEPDRPRRRRTWPERYRQLIELDETAGPFRAFSLGTVPSLLQTREFFAESVRRAVPPGATGQDLDQTLAEMAALHVRHQALVYEATEVGRIVVDEGALRRPVGPPSLLRGQLDRLCAVVREQGAARLAVLPRTAALPCAPLSSFTAYPERVLIPALAGDLWFSRADDVRFYSEAFTRLWEASVDGDEAAALLERIRDEG
ncbi:helix-turn-helix protein [Pseudonocardia sediminis]|uniref:Helix-turn-helix protein n=1 Tax=Pseudonocardia sediminis TaxID=1397368 RepID=A0A4V2FRC8_PSEST|nr:Scr1 family TA system antitoxin-like transcriptional regulator [Pseudonocardia sediminis]RZT88140.1 helix-turn-helix protein [Pseudonocardia sediminis]